MIVEDTETGELKALCLKCSLTREERMQYRDNCPMNCPELHCPWYDKPKEVVS